MTPEIAILASPPRRRAFAAVGLALFAGLLGGPAALAQSAPLAVGDEVAPKAALQIYDAPPSGVLGQTGNPSGKADPSKKYRIGKLSTFRNALGRQFWVFLQQDGGPTAGWGLAGDDADPARNLKRP